MPGEGTGTGAETEAGATPMPAARTPEEAFAARCKAIASEFSLTPREAEVFAMLAAAATAPTSRRRSSCPATP